MITQKIGARIRELRTQLGISQEKFAMKIAREIVKERENKLISTTTELSDIILSAVPSFVRRSGKHPAKKIFQA